MSAELLTTLGSLLAILLAFWQLNKSIDDKIDKLETKFDDKIDKIRDIQREDFTTLLTRIEGLENKLSIRIDALNARFDSLIDFLVKGKAS